MSIGLTWFCPILTSSFKFRLSSWSCLPPLYLLFRWPVTFGFQASNVFLFSISWQSETWQGECSFLSFLKHETVYFPFGLSSPLLMVPTQSDQTLIWMQKFSCLLSQGWHQSLLLTTATNVLETFDCAEPCPPLVPLLYLTQIVKSLIYRGMYGAAACTYVPACSAVHWNRE